MITSPALRYHGGKFRMAPWILERMPPHTCYVEPFGGAASVLLLKPRSYAEVYNDLDGDVVNFFRVMRDEKVRPQLIDALAATPYAREEFEAAWVQTDDPLERARRLCVRAQMGFGSAGATKGITGFRCDTKRAYGTAQHLWTRYPTILAHVGDRLSGVLVESRPALWVLGNYDAENTLHYVDPPYVHDTRVMRARGGYRHEMTDADHLELLAKLRSVSGMVMLSGYDCELYRDSLPGWEVQTVQSRISAGRGAGVRMESLWCNPACTLARMLS